MIYIIKLQTLLLFFFKGLSFSKLSLMCILICTHISLPTEEKEKNTQPRKPKKRKRKKLET